MRTGGFSLSIHMRGRDLDETKVDGHTYMQAEPGAPPFVSVGDKVSEGDTVLIVEAMKTMNQIPAPRAGRVTAILVEDGQPVEYGEPLVILE